MTTALWLLVGTLTWSVLVLPLAVGVGRMLRNGSAGGGEPSR